MLEISIDSASTVNRDQASLKTTHPHSTKQRSQYTLKLKKKKRREPLRDRKQRSRNALIVVEVKMITSRRCFKLAQNLGSGIGLDSKAHLQSRKKFISAMNAVSVPTSTLSGMGVLWRRDFSLLRV